MIDFAQVAIVVFLFIIVLMILAKNPFCPDLILVGVGNDSKDDSRRESFDVYYNHDMGAHTAYQGGFLESSPSLSIDESELRATYRWSDKTPDGDNVYDKFYEGVVVEKNGDFDPNYDYSHTSGDAYDMKFNHVPNGQGYDLTDHGEGLPRLHRTFEHQRLPGFGIELSQKNWMN